MENTIKVTLPDALLEKLTNAVRQVVKEELPKYQDQFRKDWLSTKEVMQLLDVSRRTLRNYRKEGMLAYSQLASGGKILYPREQIETFLQERLVEASSQSELKNEKSEPKDNDKYSFL